MAVKVLCEFPREELTEKIEEDVQKAYESYDVVRLAGLMYMAKEIDYEIKKEGMNEKS